MGRQLIKLFEISNHAPGVGSDVDELVRILGAGNISIHAPREGSDWEITHAPTLTQPFQSTLPVRGATRLRLPSLK